MNRLIVRSFFAGWFFVILTVILTPSALSEKEAGPTKTYLAYREAVLSGEWEDIRTFVPELGLTSLEASGNLDLVVAALQNSTAETVKVVSEEVVSENVAILIVDGSGPDQDKSWRVTMLQERGRWKVGGVDSITGAK